MNMAKYAILPECVVVRLPIIRSSSLRSLDEQTHTVEVALFIVIEFVVRSTNHLYHLFTVTQLITATPRVNCQDLQVELDTGAALSIVSEKTFKSVFKDTICLQLSLRIYSGEDLTILGIAEVNVTYESKNNAALPLVVMKGQCSSLFGHNWLQHIRLNWSSVKSSVQELLKKHSRLFPEELGTLEGDKAKIIIHLNVQTCFFKPRPVPYALKNKVEKEFDRLQLQGVITTVQFSDQAAPVVKTDGTIHVCGDYKVTVNTVSKDGCISTPLCRRLVHSPVRTIVLKA